VCTRASALASGSSSFSKNLDNEVNSLIQDSGTGSLHIEGYTPLTDKGRDSLTTQTNEGP